LRIESVPKKMRMQNLR